MDSHVKGWWADTQSSVVFLTRLPIRVPQAIRQRPISEAMRAFPLVGALVGLLGGLAFALAAAFGMQPLICGALAVAVLLLVTGAFHEDGFADVWDGIGGGMTSERKLEIMHDSRLGTYGTAALVLALLLRFGALSVIGSYEGPGRAILCLLAVGALSRAALVGASALMPLAQLTGQAADAGRASHQQMREAGLVALIIGVLCLGIVPLIVATFTLLGFCYAWCKFVQTQIGGQTGDVLGSVQQVAEISALIALAAMFD